MKYFVCNNAGKLLGSSGHSRRHHEGSGDKERVEERDRRQGEREERRQGEREERRQGEREERRQGEREERHQERDRRQGDREVDKMISGVEALNVSSDSTSTEVTP